MRKETTISATKTMKGWAKSIPRGHVFSHILVQYQYISERFKSLVYNLQSTNQSTVSVHSFINCIMAMLNNVQEYMIIEIIALM